MVPRTTVNGPGGTTGNSPTFQRWVGDFAIVQVPQGRPNNEVFSINLSRLDTVIMNPAIGFTEVNGGNEGSAPCGKFRSEGN